MELWLVVLPVFLIFATGFISQRILQFDIKTISTFALYVLSPFLAFKTFYYNELTMDYLYIAVFCLLLLAVLFIIVSLTATLLQASQSERSAMLLGGVFMNSGNYGAPVLLFAFGEIAFDFAIVLMVFQAVLMNSFGIFFASMGGKEKSSIKDSLDRVVRMPVLHATILGVLFQMLAIQLPHFAFQAIDLIADASVPTVMLVLGMQLAVISKGRVKAKFVYSVTILRMIVSPLVAVGIVFLLPISPLLKTVMIVQAAMPAAANTTMFALQFGTEPDLVSYTTFITTMCSLLTIPLIVGALAIYL